MINVESKLEPMPVGAGLIEEAAERTLTHQAVAGDLTILLSDDGRVRELNRQYLGIDTATDVLSFPASEADPDTGATYLGDVIISVSQAGAQARASGHGLEAEVQLLVVHGVLHLLGHDHAQPEGKERMWAAQADVLRQLGLSDMEIRE
jgi:probable rRNA maturation factor